MVRKRGCPHRYWEINSRHRYRRCKYCWLMEYNFRGKWEREVGMRGFFQKWLRASNADTMECPLCEGSGTVAREAEVTK